MLPNRSLPAETPVPRGNQMSARLCLSILLLLLPILVPGCQSTNGGGRVHSKPGVYLPGDVIYVTVDEKGELTDQFESKLTLEGPKAAAWDEVTKVRPYPVTGGDTDFNAGLSFLTKKLTLNFGVSGATITRIGERFPDDAEKQKNVYGRAAIRRAPFDSWQTAFEEAMKQPYQRYLPNRIPRRPDQRAFYVEQVIYTNAYYASTSAHIGADLATTVFGADNPLKIGAAASGGSFAYHLTKDATSISADDWDFNDAKNIQTVLGNWVTVQVVLQELDLTETPTILGGTLWENSEVWANAKDKPDFTESHTQPLPLPMSFAEAKVLEVGPNQEYEGQTACWAISKVTVSPIETTAVRMKWAITVESRCGGKCGPDGDNTGGHGIVAPRAEMRFFVPGKPQRWSFKASGIANGPTDGKQAELHIQGPDIEGENWPLKYGSPRFVSTAKVLDGGDYTVQVSGPRMKCGCVGTKGGSRVEDQSSFSFDISVDRLP